MKKLTFLLGLGFLFLNTAWAMPLPSETSDLVLVCRGLPSSEKDSINKDADNVIVMDYVADRIYWYGDFTNKRLYNELNIVDEKRENSFFGGTKEIIDVALALPGQPVQTAGRIVKSSKDNFITATIGNYTFRARCIFYPPQEYRTQILPQLMQGG